MSGMTEQPAAASLNELAGTLDPGVATVLDRALAGKDITAEEGTSALRQPPAPSTTPRFWWRTNCAAARSATWSPTWSTGTSTSPTSASSAAASAPSAATSAKRKGTSFPSRRSSDGPRKRGDYGATEVCIQAGLPPQMEGDLYIRLCAAIKEALPDMHIHGFSPEEVLYGSVRSRCTIREYLEGLRDAGGRQPAGHVGGGTGPGTPRPHIAGPDHRGPVDRGGFTTAPRTGKYRLLSTVMFGHRETLCPALSNHMALLRGLQQEDGRHHRVRPAQLRSHRSPDVSEEPGPERASRSDGHGRGQDARHRPNHVEQLDP